VHPIGEESEGYDPFASRGLFDLEKKRRPEPSRHAGTKRGKNRLELRADPSIDLSHSSGGGEAAS